MRKNIQIINGPNLNLLGKREPETYGNQSFESYFKTLKGGFKNIFLHYYQSNHEGGIIDKIHDVGFRYHGIVLNPGAYAHYSYAIADAIKAIDIPVIEVHISDIFSREDFRKNLVTSDGCIKMISGKGLEGYRNAVEILRDL